MINSALMFTNFLLPILLLLSPITLLPSFANVHGPKPLQTYIVHVSPPESPAAALEWHSSFLPSTGRKGRMVHSYGHAFSGFAARLSEEEVEGMQGIEGFVHAQPDKKLQLHTTYTPAFLGLRQEDPLGLWNMSNFGKGMIIGILDTGIWPDHPSFDDRGMPPPPAKWKGVCMFNSSYRCNNKIIGARVFYQGWKAAAANGSSEVPTPLDDYGHGTATASVAAGMFVKNANELGQANGTASGMAPYAHLAAYKVCTNGDCFVSDLIAGIESAVRDGVDVISMSLGGSPVPLYNDSIAIATFGAVAKGVFVSSSAGNGGPFRSSTINEIPWITTVGAGTTSRSIRATVRLGNGEEFRGESVYQPTNFSSRLLPLVYPSAMNGSDFFAYYCFNNSLDGLDVKGKIVVCNVGLNKRVEKSEVVRKAGGAGMIIPYIDSVADAYVLPASTAADGTRNITSYVSNTPDATAAILFKGTVFDTVAPSVAGLSSRGPTTAIPGILKPDIIAPGLNILAAWNSNTNPFKVVSGTSFSCPHLAGIAALLRVVHPDWSPAMIRSAIMTSANITNSAGKRIVDNYNGESASFFDIGAGQVNPQRAISPGLVYDLQLEDYIGYLCGLDITDKNVGAIVHRAVNCSERRRIDGMQLNYPSIYVELGTYSSVEATVERTVTNVGHTNSTYQLKLERPLGVVVKVEPTELKFKKIGEKKTFMVHMTRNNTEWMEYLLSSNQFFSSASSGTLTWASMDGKYSARSVIAVYMKQ